MRTKIETLGDNAIGTIGPEPRIAEYAITEAEVNEFAARLATDEFYDEVGELGPNAAGGTFSLVVADALTTGRFRQPGQKADEHAKVIYTWLVENANTPENRLIIPRQCIDGRPVAPGSKPSDSLIGGHDSTHGKDDCGAEKKLPEILAYIAVHADIVRAIAESEGVEVDDASHQLIAQNAQALLDEEYAVDALQLRDSLTSVAGEDCVKCLDGDHHEVAARKNRNPAITLDREKIQDMYGSNRLEAFNVDAGVFEAAAGIISLTADEQKWKTLAMEYYNTAAALVLADPSLRYIA